MSTPQILRPVACFERGRLAHAHKVAQAKSDQVTALLSNNAGMMTVAEYREMRDHGEKARRAVEAARNAMDQHVGQHGCYCGGLLVAARKGFSRRRSVLLGQ